MNSQVLIDREFLQELKFLLVQPGTKIDARYLLISGIDRALSTPAPIPDSDHVEPVRAMVVPEGWRLVPAEPTIEMIAAIGFDGDAELAIGHAAISAQCVETYHAMLAASPAPGDSQ